MDTERGNLEILFQKIPYYYIAAEPVKHDYKTVDETLYLSYAKDVFYANSEDEIRSRYMYLQQKVKDHTVFLAILDFAQRFWYMMETR